jgi:hypothetical protein
MNFTRGISLLFSVLALSGFYSCTDSLTGGYSDPDKAEIVDDRWSQTDAKKTGDALIAKMLKESKWIEQYMRRNGGKRPIAVVDEIRNDTDEHISTQYLTNMVKNALINSGKVRFLNKEARQRILEEMSYQHDSDNVGKSKRTRRGNQLGSGLFFGGNIQSITNEFKGEKSVTYQTSLKMTDLESTEEIWVGLYEIRKNFKRSKSIF